MQSRFDNIGVDQNLALAVFWTRLAADQGSKMQCEYRRVLLHEFVSA